MHALRFNEKFRPFFKEGKRFRFPCYLATSFDREIAEGFRRRAHGQGYPTVRWTVCVHPKGKTQPVLRCAQVNFVTKVAKKVCGFGKTADAVEDEFEWLFQHFAAFYIHKVKWSDAPKVFEQPHEITILALPDSRKEAEDLPLAPWS